MNLLITYLACLFVAQAGAIAVGLAVDKMYSSYGGLVVFLFLYFTMFWVAWRIAIRITAPKPTSTAPPAS